MRKVIGVGETILDILFRNNQPLAAVPGGSCFNSIISLGRAGVPCTFVGYTGGDQVGQQTVDFLHENGVETDYFEKREGEKSAISLAFLNDHGDANYSFYKPIPHADADSPIPVFGADDIMLFGSYYASCKGTRPQVRRLLEASRAAGSIVYYDLNFRKSHQHELDELRPTLLENFGFSTVVRGSADDFEIMYGERDARTIYQQHIAHYCPIFICTSGPGLITVCTPTMVMDFPVPQVKTVSTVGAGDNFNAGFVYALMHEGILHDQLTTLSRERWTSLIEMGCRFAAEVCQSTSNSVSRDFCLTLSHIQ